MPTVHFMSPYITRRPTSAGDPKVLLVEPCMYGEVVPFEGSLACKLKAFLLYEAESKGFYFVFSGD